MPHPTHPKTGRDIREAFLRFFEEKCGHQRRPSASLIPVNNPTVLLTPAGMLPFVPIFLGIEPRPNPPRLTTVQKCARVSGKDSDLENIGRTPRHHTFFEMLGNFSFGDYFREDVIPWSWEFCTEVLGLDPERLWVSVYEEDLESEAIWLHTVGIPAERLFKCGKKDNFWGPPGASGPCGPCTEIHYDLTQNPADDLDTRLIEIWNLVLMESFQDAQGKISPLEHKNVDTGAGLERLAMVVQGVNNTFETDLLQNVVKAVTDYTGIPYRQHEETDVALKIVADHLRLLAFTMADGIVPSNEGRGYIIRMVLRRAVRFGKRFLGMNTPFLHALLPVIQAEYGHHYPELVQRLAYTQRTIQQEEARFLETLDKGTKRLDEVLEHLTGDTLSGEEAFKLYDTYGFPVELTKDMVQERGLHLDEAGFQTAMQAAKAMARSARKQVGVLDDQSFTEIYQDIGATRFVGYDQLDAEVTIKALLLNGERVSRVGGTNTAFQCILDQSPFYAESGGQVGDRGQLHLKAGQGALTVLVKDVQKVGDLFVHHCLYDQGEGLHEGDVVTAEIDERYRHQVALHHSGTHLVHAALKKVLGTDVAQAGSYVGAESARFDFSFHRGISAEELHQIEGLVNHWIQAGEATHVSEASFEEAKKQGAVALFGEKYGDTVRVVSIGSHSKELCGGTHVQNTADLAVLKINHESALASGVRRLEFVVGYEAYRQFRQAEHQLKALSLHLKTPTADIFPRLLKLQNDLRHQEKTIKGLEEKILMSRVPELVHAFNTADTSPILVKHLLPDAPSDALKALGEAVINQASSKGVLVLGSVSEEGNALILVWVAEAVVKSHGIKAGDIVKTLAQACGGGGGGKPTFAQAGGKNGAALESALNSLTLSSSLLF
jgi:alanyl-tRNA synthetase